MSHGAPNARRSVRDRAIRVSRNKWYALVLFSGEARIIKGSSHRVNRIKGVLRASEIKIEDIGVLLLRRGMQASVKINEVFKVVAVFNLFRVRSVIPINVRVRGIIQVAMYNRSWAPKARILV